MNEWILCSEKLPQPGQTVLISQSYGFKNRENMQEVTIAYFNGSYFTWYAYRDDWKHQSILDHGDVCPGMQYVDAWMPLPKSFWDN